MIKNKVTVSVVSKFIPEISKIEDAMYYYLYEVCIQNKSKKNVKLISRHWNIVDGDGHFREIEGEGVVGKTPTIKPGMKYKYKSYCPLKTEFGSMSGYYTMKDEEGDVFKVNIPEFPLVLKNIIN